MNYNPSCPEPDKTIGFSPHYDANALTILFELNDTEGLEIRKEGRWILVKALPNAFVVNIGDITKRCSFFIHRGYRIRPQLLRSNGVDVRCAPLPRRIFRLPMKDAVCPKKNVNCFLI